MFESKLEEGQIYEMSYVSIFPQSGFYRAILQPYKLVFQIKTKVNYLKSQLGLSFTNLGEICAYTHDYEFLVG
jgi:hypothetical protein